ncbi:hypothetical protein EVAR_8617_1 [Eumeta japonica]|uniref:Uncharacterized protein n=1 Tax=Eumeta variegata TaxID=151549 RepID=A0A4C1XFT1_EUMVA|nr:hypothetical protein EVAR_8617_1 [Eumeta japonica]
MAGRRRLYTAGSFILSVFSLVLIMVSAATDYWVQADVRVQSGAGRPDTLHYGLYGGKVDFAQTSPPVRNVLHVVCVLSAKACAVTCKTTPAARRQEVIYLSTGYRPATLACDDNTNFNRHQPQAGQRPVLSTALYVAVNLFLLLQLLYALCSALLALVNTFEDLTHPLLGLQGFCCSLFCFPWAVRLSLHSACILMAEERYKPYRDLLELSVHANVAPPGGKRNLHCDVNLWMPSSMKISVHDVTIEEVAELSSH